MKWKSNEVATYASLLQQYAKAKDVVQGKRVHDLISGSSHAGNPFLGDLLVQMYGKCKCVSEACQIFDSLCRKNIHSWNFVIGACAQNGYYEEALEFYYRMQSQGIAADRFTFSRILPACSSARFIADGTQIHANVNLNGCHSDVAVQNALIRMYAKCGRLSLAREVFERMSEKDLVTWNSIISAYAQQGYLSEALETYKEMNIEPDRVTFASVLGACSSLKDGQEIHNKIVINGIGSSDLVVQNALINMYSKCQRFDLARKVFDEMEERDSFSWNAIIGTYAQNGQHKEAFDIFSEMSKEPDLVTFTTILSICSDLSQGLEIHERMMRSGLQLDIVVLNSLLNMYAKCGHLEAARRVFDEMTEKNVISWTSLIIAFAQKNYFSQAILLFQEMNLEGTQPNSVTFPCIIRACGALRNLKFGQEIHARTSAVGLEEEKAVQHALIVMYGKCGDTQNAQAVFDRLKEKNVQAWNSLLGAFAQCGHLEKVLQIFDVMDCDGDAATYITVLGVCTHLGNLPKGEEIHEQINISSPFVMQSEVLQNVLVNMYAKCNCLEKARQLFEVYQQRNSVILWTCMIAANAQYGEYLEASMLYERMHLEGLRPNNLTCASILNAYSNWGLPAKGKAIHEQVVGSVLESDVTVRNTLLHMYSKSSSSISAAEDQFNLMAFKDVVSWTSMISAYAQHGHFQDALITYGRMNLHGLRPNDATLSTIFTACASASSLSDGKKIYDCIESSGIKLHINVQNSILNMYSKCGGRLECVKDLFDKMPTKNVVSQNVMMAALVQHGHSTQAIGLYKQVEEPDGVTFATALLACTTGVDGLEMGRLIHSRMILLGDDNKLVGFDCTVYNALMNMYGKCGVLEAARGVFEGMPHRDVVSWNTMIAAAAQHGEFDTVIGLHERMRQEGVVPDSVTSMSVLVVCSHAGLLSRGRECFVSVVEESGVSVEHYVCMVDLLSRSGRLEEAKEVMECMEMEKEDVEELVVGWRSLLGACRFDGDIEKGDNVANNILDLQPQAPASSYIMLSTIYNLLSQNNCSYL